MTGENVLLGMGMIPCPPSEGMSTAKSLCTQPEPATPPVKNQPENVRIHTNP